MHSLACRHDLPQELGDLAVCFGQFAGLQKFRHHIRTIPIAAKAQQTRNIAMLDLREYLGFTNKPRPRPQLTKRPSSGYDPLA